MCVRAENEVGAITGNIENMAYKMLVHTHAVVQQDDGCVSSDVFSEGPHDGRYSESLGSDNEGVDWCGQPKYAMSITVAGQRKPEVAAPLTDAPQRRQYLLVVLVAEQAVGEVDDTILGVGDAVGLENDGPAMGPLVDSRGGLFAVESDDGVLGSEGAAEMEGNEGANCAEADDVDVHRQTASGRATERRHAEDGSGDARRQFAWEIPPSQQGELAEE